MKAGARADVALVERGLFPSRAKAREAIEAGLVRAGGRAVAKPSEQIAPDEAIEARALYPWVSRGGVKLEAALDAFGFDPAGCVCLDIGASTGGFTDVLLARGAARVVAVDVGTGQLHERLRADPRVKSLEQTDARALTRETVGEPDLIVVDVSFISLRHILPAALALAATKAVPAARLVALVKPQFEVGPEFVKKGIVRDQKARERALRDIAEVVAAQGWRVVGEIVSPVTGGDGNVEYLIGAERT